ncbi:MAG TPA: N-6 DNA methylase [Solirubrobacterales bacterium]|nr:N-6 DNA methylase [Solirubrobacterales bacterium]
MAQRHGLQSGDLQSIFGRLEELVLANSGEDEFQEIFKLLVAKLYTEKHPSESICFGVQGTPEETTAEINKLIAMAANRWKGIVVGDPRSRLTPDHLAICVEAIESETLLDASLEVLDGAFEYLVARSAKGSKGQYFTPRHVIDCCVQIADPDADELVIDPASGSAGFLVHTLLHVTGSRQLDAAEYASRNLWGFDFDQRAIQVAKALMLLAGDGHTNLYRANSLLTSRGTHSLPANDEEGETLMGVEDVVRTRLGRSFKGFDIVLTNPPFAGEIRENSLLEAYDLYRPGRRIERDIIFLERCLQLLRPGGRIGIVLPHNKLGGSAWAYARDWLLRQMRVVAVLSLGRNTFLPHTHQKADVLFGVKRARPEEPSPDEEILFLLSERAGKDSKGRIVERAGSEPGDPAWTRADHDLDEVVTAFRDFIAASETPWGAN